MAIAHNYYTSSDKNINSQDFSNDEITTTDSIEGREHSIFIRRTMRYVDFRILPFFSLLYAFSLVDRVNLGAARTAGLGDAIALDVGSRYSIVSCLYFVPFLLFQLPANLILRRVGVRNCISFSVISWGVVQLSMGFVKHWGHLILCRVLLGAFEASFSPAMLFLIATWYTRYEVQTRIAAYYLLAVAIGGGFSPILAYGLSQLDGKQGIAGWS